MAELHIPEYGQAPHTPTQDAYDAACRALHAQRERADKAERSVRLLATALDSVGARIYRDINPHSSYQPVNDERLVKLLSDFTAYAEEHLAVLDNPDVIQVLADAKKGS